MEGIDWVKIFQEFWWAITPTMAVVATAVLKWISTAVVPNLPFWLKPIISAIVGALIAALGGVDPAAGVIAGFAGSKIYDYGDAWFKNSSMPLRNS